MRAVVAGNVSFTDYASRIRLSDCSKLTINRKNNNDVTICKRDVIFKFFDVVFLLLSSLVTGLSLMSVSSVVLELRYISFIRDWPEIRKPEILPSEFCPISRSWGKLGIPNSARMSLIKCYRTLQKSRVTAFTVSGLLRENQQGFPDFD